MAEGPSSPPPATRHLLPPSRRLHTRADFAGAYDARAKRSAGPILMFSRPNGLGHPRLGTSLSRKVGNSVRRHRIKRLLREAFRLGQHELPSGYDYLIVVRPHAPLELAEYQRMLSELAGKLDAEWKRRGMGVPPVSF